MWLEGSLLYIIFGLSFFFSPYMSSAETTPFCFFETTKVRTIPKRSYQKKRVIFLEKTTAVQEKNPPSFFKQTNLAQLGIPGRHLFVLFFFRPIKSQSERKQKCSCGSSRSTPGAGNWGCEEEPMHWKLIKPLPISNGFLSIYYVFITWLVVASM